MRLPRIPERFDHPHFMFEPNIDGFTAMAHIRAHRCELVSRNGHVFQVLAALVRRDRRVSRLKSRLSQYSQGGPFAAC
jgi:hypothetical protein